MTETWCVLPCWCKEPSGLEGITDSLALIPFTSSTAYIASAFWYQTPPSQILWAHPRCLSLSLAALLLQMTREKISRWFNSDIQARNKELQNKTWKSRLSCKIQVSNYKMHNGLFIYFILSYTQSDDFLPREALNAIKETTDLRLKVLNLRIHNWLAGFCGP